MNRKPDLLAHQNTTSVPSTVMPPTTLPSMISTIPPSFCFNDNHTFYTLTVEHCVLPVFVPFIGLPQPANSCNSESHLTSLSSLSSMSTVESFGCAYSPDLFWEIIPEDACSRFDRDIMGGHPCLFGTDLSEYRAILQPRSETVSAATEQDRDEQPALPPQVLSFEERSLLGNDSGPDSPESSWSPSWSEDIPVDAESHPVFQLRREYLEFVVTAYHQHQIKDQISTYSSVSGLEAGPSMHNPPQGEPRGRGGGQAQKSSGKRSQSSSSTHDSGEKTGRRASNKRQAVARRFSFACPFAKKDTTGHRTCYRYCLTRIRDVKQHLKRCHRMPEYCPRCSELFDDEERRNEHLRGASCEVGPPPQIEGISKAQQSQLGRRVASQMSEEDQWFTVFDILFPGHPRPRSPYMDWELSEQMQIFSDFLVLQGNVLLSSFLDSQHAVTWELPFGERDSERFQHNVLADGLQYVFDQFTSANPGHRASPGILSASQNMSEDADSGISLQENSGENKASKANTCESSNNTADPLNASMECVSTQTFLNLEDPFPTEAEEELPNATSGDRYVSFESFDTNDYEIESQVAELPSISWLW